MKSKIDQPNAQCAETKNAPVKGTLKVKSLLFKLNKVNNLL